MARAVPGGNLRRANNFIAGDFMMKWAKLELVSGAQ
jgi:hypothetical protein